MSDKLGMPWKHRSIEVEDILVSIARMGSSGEANDAVPDATVQCDSFEPMI